MLARLSDRLTAFFRATAPDPFVIAVLLTLLTAALALWRTDTTPQQLIDSWSGSSGAFGKDGVWRLLGFAMQMCLILVTGHALASTRPALWLIDLIAARPRTGAHAAALVAAAACGLGLINWGLALIGGAILARRVGIALHRRGIAAHYPLLAAAGYMGLLVFHGGFSGSAPLKVTTQKDLTELLGEAAIGMQPIPLTNTLLSPMNFIITGGMCVLCPVLFYFMHPKPGSALRTIDRVILDFSADEPSTTPSTLNTFDGERPGFIPRLLEETPIINFTLAAIIAWWAWGYYFPGGGRPSGVWSLTPDSVNLTMLMLGLILHGTPRRYLAAVDDAASGCGGIIIQFPLYAGIMGMMQSSGLTALIASDLTSTSTPATLPVLTFIAAIIVGLFIPSGGAQWVVQGPIALKTAADMGVEPSKMVMAIAYGDELANMLQPFWALPLLAVTGVKGREIIGYTAIAMLASAAWIAGVMLVM